MVDMTKETVTSAEIHQTTPQQRWITAFFNTQFHRKSPIPFWKKCIFTYLRTHHTSKKEKKVRNTAAVFKPEPFFRSSLTKDFYLFPIWFKWSLTKTNLQRYQHRDLLRLFPTSPLDVAASFRRTIPMVIAASIVVVKETLEIDANKIY